MSKVEEKHDGDVFKDVIEKMGFDIKSFMLVAIFRPNKMLKLSESFPLSENEKRVLEDRLSLLR